MGCMICVKCKADIPEGSIFCCYCGRKQVREQRKRIRGNGQGTVYQLPSGKWRATKTLGYYLDENDKKHRNTQSKNFSTKRDALYWLSQKGEKEKKKITFKQLYDKWQPTHKNPKVP